MFLLKKLVAQFFYPVSLSLELLGLGLFFLWVTRRVRLGKILVSLGTLLLLLWSSPLISPHILTPLERHYPALLHPEALSRDGQNPGASPFWIVVLGGGHTSDPQLPVNSQISQAALGRVVEGVRLYRAIPGSKLLMSGGGAFDPVPEARVMAEIALSLGVKSQDLRLEDASRDTADQAAVIAAMLHGKPIILVTSAAHMPRAMALFARRGMHPLPAPADYLYRVPQRSSPGEYFPGVDSLRRTETAVHEYLGLAWAWLRGLI
ncbi:MAG: ElyC/SanA/YdcF family protein [Desulfobaccales bacterium]